MRKVVNAGTSFATRKERMLEAFAARLVDAFFAGAFRTADFLAGAFLATLAFAVVFLAVTGFFAVDCFAVAILMPFKLSLCVYTIEYAEKRQ